MAHFDVPEDTDPSDDLDDDGDIMDIEDVLEENADLVDENEELEEERDLLREKLAMIEQMTPEEAMAHEQENFDTLPDHDTHKEELFSHKVDMDWEEAKLKKAQFAFTFVSNHGASVLNSKGAQVEIFGPNEKDFGYEERHARSQALVAAYSSIREYFS